jgi:alkylated DNA repair dioxygenase AlkB
MPWALEHRRLDDASGIDVGKLPDSLIPDPGTFERWWDLHPEAFHEIQMHGRKVMTPRWQQAYGADYRYTGSTNRALPVPDALAPLHAWLLAEIDPRLNGLLLNWYDAARGHYIGKHRDSTINMVEGAPIVTLSFGAPRVFRIRKWKGFDQHDIPTGHGTMIVMPYATNLAWTHEVPHSAKTTGRRISITARAFESASV